MHHDFLVKYCHLAKIPKMVLHIIYYTLLEDPSHHVVLKVKLMSGWHKCLLK